LKIGFHRTLRVPEDGRVHLLPADFGLFPVQNMAAYEAKLRKSGNPSLLDMVRKSGVFFPIFQREALWLSFQVPKGSEYAIRVFVGGVNVVSGRKWDAPAKEGDHKDQDYIIVPQQKHLDGITVGDGVVRQFVAMPIGTGYSIEKQITGKEDVGGIQLEITPVSAKMRLSFANGAPIPWEQDSKTFAPRHYRLQPGEDIKMTRWDMGDAWLGGKRTTEQKKLIRELLKPSPNGVHIVTAEPPQESWAMGLAAGGLIKQEIRRDTNIYRSPRLNQATTTLISVQLLNSVAYEAITGMLCPPTPITMREYVNAGIPWFDNYKNQTASTEGAYNFNRIASVAEID
ncbi:hypothetical protein K458DRAFT_250340, partial [Lentithecium fluviatile CBS 122367]